MYPDPLIQEGGRESTFRPTVLFIVQRYLRRATHTLPPLDPKREGPAPLPNSFFLPALPWDMEGEEGEEWGRRHKSSFRKEEVGGEKKIKPQGKRGRGESYLKGKAGAFDEINK